MINHIQKMTLIITTLNVVYKVIGLKQEKIKINHPLYPVVKQPLTELVILHGYIVYN